MTAEALRRPLRFRPVYQRLIWGGRRMAAFRDDLPEGPIGESWDLSDHERGRTVVAEGPLAGQTLQALMQEHREALVGAGFGGDMFPVLVKMLDARDRLSLQVHPDDQRAQELGVGRVGKTECWYVVADGGSLFQGTRPGVDRTGFEAALAAGRVEETLNRFDVRTGDFFFMAARTVHALGEGCLIFEIQQTCDVTFRVWDWGRVGLDGQPRPLHVRESLETIDFAASGVGPRPAVWTDGGTRRALADCAYFTVEEQRTAGLPLAGAGDDRCTILCGLEGEGRLETAAGGLSVGAMQTVLVPAAAGAWRFTPTAGTTARLLVTQPRW